MKNILSKLTDKSTLLVVGGTALASAGLYMLGKASMKCDIIMAEHKTNEKTIEECDIVSEEYSEEDKANDIKINNIQTTAKLITNYIVPGAMIVGGGIMYMKGKNKVVEKLPDNVVQATMYRL